MAAERELASGILPPEPFCGICRALARGGKILGGREGSMDHRGKCMKDTKWEHTAQLVSS